MRVWAAQQQEAWQRVPEALLQGPEVLQQAPQVVQVVPAAWMQVRPPRLEALPRTAHLSDLQRAAFLPDR